MHGWLAALTVACIDLSVQDPDATATDTVRVTETFQQQPAMGVDILWVLDDTGSMAEEQDAVAAAMADFAEGLLELDLAWQVGVITTDMADGGVLRGNPWIVTPAAEDPVAALQANAAVGTDGLGPEAGLAAMVAALTDPVASEENRGFRRDDAALQVIVVSDADDASDPWLDDPVASATDLLLEEAARTGAPALLTAVVGDPGVGCTGPTGAALPGDRYVEVAEATGGDWTSLCAEDLEVSLAGRFDDAVVWQDRFPLQADPLDGTVEVRVDGERVLEGWWVDHAGPALVFEAPPPPGAWIEASYSIAGEAA